MVMEAQKGDEKMRKGFHAKVIEARELPLVNEMFTSLP